MYIIYHNGTTRVNMHTCSHSIHVLAHFTHTHTHTHIQTSMTNSLVREFMCPGCNSLPVKLCHMSNTIDVGGLVAGDT